MLDSSTLISTSDELRQRFAEPPPPNPARERSGIIGASPTPVADIAPGPISRAARAIPTAPAPISYLADQWREADAASAAGKTAHSIGIRARGLATLPLVHVAEAAGATYDAAKGPVLDFLSGVTGIEASPPLRDATVGPSVAAPRRVASGPISEGIPLVQEGRSQSVTVPQYGPIQSVAVPQGDGINNQQAQAIVGNPIINAELQRYQAQDAQRLQASNEAMRQQGAWADAWTAQRDAEGKARVANFQARNGADMVLAGGNSRNNPVQTAILAQQAAANAGLSEANKNLAGVYGQKGPITDYVGQQQKQQALDQQGQKNANDAIGKQAETEGKQLDAASKKQILELQQRLLGAKTPEERKSIEDMIVAIHGRSAQQDKVAVVDVDTGQKDMLGQPIYKKAAVNTVTGQLVGQGPIASGGSQALGAVDASAVAKLKKTTPEDAQAQAKAAVARGVPVSVVNDLLAKAGLPTL